MSGAPPAGWLDGEPMDPTATPHEPLAAVAGFPFAYPGACVTIVGPTGGGRSSLIEACAYDAGKAEQRVAYLGHEVTREEFDARAAALAERRGDEIDKGLLTALAAIRYLDLTSTLAAAWSDPDAWVEGIVARYDVVAIDPLSAVAAALDFDFDKSNREYVLFHGRLIQPLVSRGVSVAIVDNVGHAIEAKSRAKGASAKGDLSDVLIACSPHPHGLLVNVRKVRSVRAPFRRGDAWLFREREQSVEPFEREQAERVATSFRPTNIMEKVSREIEQHDGLSKTAIRTAIGGNAKNVDLALELLIAEGHIERRQDGPQKLSHHSLRPYREATESAESEPSPDQVSDPVPTTESDRVLSPVRRGRGDELGSAQPEPGNRVRSRSSADHDSLDAALDDGATANGKGLPSAYDRSGDAP
ncbi:MAG TPA: hypothetical protein VII01_04870 [Solirubrobacteraceae bacterium]